MNNEQNEKITKLEEQVRVLQQTLIRMETAMIRALSQQDVNAYDVGCAVSGAIDPEQIEIIE